MPAFRRDGGGGTGSPRKTGKKSSYANPLATQSPKAAIGPNSPGYGVLTSSPANRNTPRQAAPSGGGGGGGGGGYQAPYMGGGGGGGQFDAMSMMAPAVSAPTEEDYLAGDSGYQTQASALQSALQRFLADSDFQKTSYETDYGKSLRDLGYDEGNKAWNWNDELTASGRGYQNQLDDFGSRGMLQSSGYADAFQELQRLLGQQYDALSGAKTNFMTDLSNQTANYKAENTANLQAARAEALQRRAAQYAL